MKKIMMNKYGFIRWPEEDFSDDGNRFTCYKAGERVRVSKLVDRGEVYISASIDGTMLPYEVYSKLPHYTALAALNGVSMSTLTDEDLKSLYENCLAYEEEYTKAEQTIDLPTIDEIIGQCRIVKAGRQAELKEVEELLLKTLNIVIEHASDYEWRQIKDYFKSLNAKANHYNPTEVAMSLVGSARSIDFCKATCYELKPSYYYSALLELINKIIGKAHNNI